MTERQPYRVVARNSGFELRRYPARLVAEVRVEGDFTKAGNEAFRQLARYIGGANRSRREIGMTAPVVQEEGDRPGSWLVRFVMPASFTAATLPEPEDPRVTTREIPEQLVAAMRFSGRWTMKAFEERATALGRAVADAGFQPGGAVRYARYDPPWQPWFLRRNEVLLPIAE